VTPSGDGRPSLDATDIPLADDDEDAPFAEPTDIEEELPDDEVTNDELTSDEATAAGETGDGAATGAATAGVAGSRPSPPKIRDQKAASIRASDAAKSAAATPTRRKLGRRTTPKGVPVKAAPKSGRYTHPIPKEQRQSPPWFPWVLLGFLVLGLLTIVLNYVNVLPGGTNNWYLIGGIVLIVIGLFGATFYH